MSYQWKCNKCDYEEKVSEGAEPTDEVFDRMDAHEENNEGHDVNEWWEGKSDSD
jgi:hypothetical protein